LPLKPSLAKNELKNGKTIFDVEFVERCTSDIWSKDGQNPSVQLFAEEKSTFEICSRWKGFYRGESSFDGESTRKLNVTIKRGSAPN
jgi:hypothetical protein